MSQLGRGVVLLVLFCGACGPLPPEAVEETPDGRDPGEAAARMARELARALGNRAIS